MVGRDRLGAPLAFVNKPQGGGLRKTRPTMNDGQVAFLPVR